VKLSPEQRDAMFRAIRADGRLLSPSRGGARAVLESLARLRLLERRATAPGEPAEYYAAERVLKAWDRTVARLLAARRT
jgi:hypothetical protein